MTHIDQISAYAEFMTPCDADAAIAMAAIGEPVRAIELQAARYVLSGEMPVQGPFLGDMEAFDD